jgi:hypothetical protein
MRKLLVINELAPVVPGLSLFCFYVHYIGWNGANAPCGC